MIKNPFLLKETQENISSRIGKKENMFQKFIL